jgi:hypothetical protein
MKLFSHQAYERLLNLIADRRQQTTAEACSALRRPFGQLRAGFQERGRIEVDYSSVDIIDAYMLAYFPSYVTASYSVFGRGLLRDALIERAGCGQIHIVLIGGGPCPEVFGVLEVLAQSRRFRALRVTLLDLHAGAWKRAIAYNTDLIERIYPRVTVTWDVLQRNLTVPLDSESLAACMNCDFVIAQNCGNELASERAFAENIKKVVDGAAQDVVLALADLHRYDAVSKIWRSLREVIGLDRLQVLEPEWSETLVNRFSNRSYSGVVPALLNSAFFDRSRPPAERRQGVVELPNKVSIHLKAESYICAPVDLIAEYEEDVEYDDDDGNYYSQEWNDRDDREDSGYDPYEYTTVDGEYLYDHLAERGPGAIDADSGLSFEDVVERG